jgi:TRAP-type C4-dicarboxylate transport system substrate-binding protein
MSGSVFDGLDEETQQIFLDAAQEAAEYERAWVAEQESDQLQALKDNGMEVIEDPDLESFKEAVQPVYDQYTEYADYVARIQEVIAGLE